MSNYFMKEAQSSLLDAKEMLQQAHSQLNDPPHYRSRYPLPELRDVIRGIDEILNYLTEIELASTS